MSGAAAAPVPEDDTGKAAFADPAGGPRPSAFAVPVVDIGGWRTGDPAERAAIAIEVDRACREIGFFQVSGHAIDSATIDAALAAMDSFFALDRPAKDACLPPGPEINRGYAPSGSEGLSYTLGLDTPPDLLEAFIVGPDHPDLDDPAVAGERDGVFAPNLWPTGLAGFREPIAAYFDAASALAHDLAEIAAVALGLDPSYFDPFLTHSTETMRLNFYERAAGAPAPLPDQSRLGAHTDYGVLTVLYADPVPGLELLDRDGRWHGVVPAPGAFIVNLGDLLAQWTNDRWRSSLHRVVPPPATSAGPARRRSLAFFLDGNHDARIECLPTCTSADRPARYAPILAGEHLAAKVLGGRTLSVDPLHAAADTIGDRRDAASTPATPPHQHDHHQSL